MSDLYFGSDLFREFNRLQRRIHELFVASRPASIPSGAVRSRKSTSASPKRTADRRLRPGRALKPERR
jgi:hypothetical protein